MYLKVDWTSSGTTAFFHWIQTHFQDTDYWSAKRSSWPNL